MPTKSIADRLDDAAVVAGYQRLQNVLVARLQGGQCSRLICLHKTVIIDYIGGKRIAARRRSMRSLPASSLHE